MAEEMRRKIRDTKFVKETIITEVVHPEVRQQTDVITNEKDLHLKEKHHHKEKLIEGGHHPHGA